MDDLKKLTCSCRGHKAHLAKLLSATEEILRKLSSAREINPDLTQTDSDAIILTKNLKQLCLKADMFKALDDKIIDNTEDKEKLEAVVYEAADLQAMLSERMALIAHTLTTSSQPKVTDPAATNTQATSPPPQPLTSETQPVQQTSETHVSGTNTSTHQPVADPINTDHSDRVPLPPVNTQSHAMHNELPHAHHFGARLPKLEIPVFTGEPLDWQPFWDCFQAANQTLTGVQKLSYLRARLRGKASRVITGLPLTNTKYQTSVILLKDRYRQSHRIISAHVQALLDLPKPSNILANLRLFYDTIETHVRCQQSLGKSPESLDTLLVPMILTKLPKRNMARNHTSAKWTVLELQAAIRNEIRIFETNQQTSPLSSQQGNPTASFYTTLHRKPQGRKDSDNKLSCVFCKSNHTVLNCEVHKDVSSRVEIIKQQRLRYNCLSHHHVAQCHSKNRCCKCGNKHHTSICNDSTKGDTSNTIQITSETAPPSTTTVDTASLTTLAPHKVPKNTTCLLKTAIATVVGTNLQMEANILFDEVSQRSFLTEKLVKELALTPYKFESISLSSFGAEKPLHRQMDTVFIRIRTTTGELVSLSVLVVPTVAPLSPIPWIQMSYSYLT